MGNTHEEFDCIGGSYRIECNKLLILFGFTENEAAIPETPVDEFEFSPSNRICSKI